MQGTTLKYHTKNASVQLMEASFNSDYDRLLNLLEEFSKTLSVTAYAQIFEILLNETGEFPSESAKSEVGVIFYGLISGIYSASSRLYRPWYVSGFGHLSSLTTAQANTLYGNAAETLAINRSITIVPTLINTVQSVARRIQTATAPKKVDEYIDGLSTRISRTESNGSAGSILEATAVSLFTEGGLFKRWISVGDERVRATHARAASKKAIPSTQLYQVGDVMMRFPADPQAFGGNVAGEMVNCRCRSLILPYTANQPNSTALNSLLIGS